MIPQQILLKHEKLIDLMINHQYLPQRSAADFGEVLGALRQIDPSANYNTSCSACLAEVARMANVHLQAYKKTIPQFYTFPKHEENKGAIGKGKKKD